MASALPRSASRLPLRPAAPRPAPRALARWLFLVAGLVFAMVVVGGITRLTESGLSIVEWKPVSGTLPPLTHQAWEAAFDAYKATPQYQQINRGMSLAAFQQIFFWEYVHRLLGRLIGLVMAAVLLTAWWRRAIPRGFGWRMVAILALGGLQGAIGWWMVKSGLQARTEVSHVRLAVHLVNALFIYAVLIWVALDLRELARDRAAGRARLSGLGLVALLLLFLQITLGAFTAGLRAGYAFASWPLMGDRLFPQGGWDRARSTAANLVNNPIAVQFVHRWWAFVVAVAMMMIAAAARRAGHPRIATALIALVTVQILLGISTLMSGVALPIAVGHQAVATLLLGALVWGVHSTGRNRRLSAV
ncbi:COX15/CtaA family protein [Sphingomonas morindae]|uniref:Heme A synthase n=1 Tax=Sphingomonas morindae TaxID=1541170 RepID=A0ABY4X4T0_9SPHN|nr:COX15/CtaA family protein [Sphingomonas morindae]USI71898.1 COX15/CtaA family protein [Sphingomonas morindae]